MNYLRYASIAMFAVALVLVALANRQMVTVQVWPQELSGMVAVNPQFSIPLFIVIFGGVLAGLVLGLFWEWLREAKECIAAARQARELMQLRAEVARLKGEKHQGKDEVLAILEEAS